MLVQERDFSSYFRFGFNQLCKGVKSSFNFRGIYHVLMRGSDMPYFVFARILLLGIFCYTTGYAIDNYCNPRGAKFYPKFSLVFVYLPFHVLFLTTPCDDSTFSTSSISSSSASVQWNYMAYLDNSYGRYHYGLE